jgi:hypothetical protein
MPLGIPCPKPLNNKPFAASWCLPSCFLTLLTLLTPFLGFFPYMHDIGKNL